MAMLNPQLRQHIELYCAKEEEEDNDDSVILIEGGEQSNCKNGSSQDDGSNSISSSSSRPKSSIACSLSRESIHRLLLECLFVLFLAVALSSTTIRTMQPQQGAAFFYFVVYGGGCWWCLGLIAIVWFVARTILIIVDRRHKAVLDDKKLKLQTESRLRVSRMLASIGSPLLLLLLETKNNCSASENNSVPSMMKNQSDHEMMIRMVEDVVQAMVDWIQTIDRVMLILRCSASVRLGLGIDSLSVARVERTSLARMARHSKKNFSIAAVSLATIRQRLYQAMRDQNNLLLSIIHPVVAVLPTKSSPSDNDDDEEEEEEREVLTLSLLQSMRRESIELVSSVAETLYATGVTEAQQRHQEIQRLLKTTREACAYFESFLECRRQQGPTKIGSHASIGSDVQAIHQQLLGLQSLVTSCHGVLYCCAENESSAFDEQQFQQLWSEFGKRFSMLHGMVENVNRHLVDRNASIGGIGNSTINGHRDLDRNALASSAMEVGEYTSGDPSGCKSSKTKKSHDGDSLNDDNKVLVYTGKGACSTSNQVRQAAGKSAPTRTLPVEPPARNPQTESLLMEELSKHLSAMPPLVEVVVAKTSDNLSSGQKAGECNNRECEPNNPSGMNRPVGGETAVAFLAELSDAIHASKLGNDALLSSTKN